LNYKVFILEDNQKLANYYTRLLEDNQFEVEHVSNGDSFFKKYEEFKPDVILLDVRLKNSQLNGIQIFQKLLNSNQPMAKVIVLSGEATRSEVAKAMKLGAHTFIEKTGDFNVEKFIADVRTAGKLKKQTEQARELIKERDELRNAFLEQNPFIGESEAVQKIRKYIKRFAEANVDVMIMGDTGTGKEVVANHIYWHSSRVGKPFVKINASGLSDSLVDSELFGHKKGSFTGAHYNKKGCFEQADGGYLFLDEIGSISTQNQAKILRAVENKEIRVIGGKTKNVDVKLIFASNKDLQKLVQDNEIRKDLYYRIARNVIHLPPLYKRDDDIILLMEYFFNKHSRVHQSNFDIDLNKIKDTLFAYPWPGNVREVSSFCENLLIHYSMVDNDKIVEGINNKLSGKFQESKDSLFKLLRIPNLSEAVEKFEKKYINYHLNLHDNNITRTAKEIGIERTTFYRKMK